MNLIETLNRESSAAVAGLLDLPCYFSLRGG